MKLLINIVVLVVVLGFVGAIYNANRPASSSASLASTPAATSEPRKSRPYSDELADIAKAMKNFDLTGDLDTTADILASVQMIDVWASIISRGNSITMTEDEAAERKRLIITLGKMQAAALPALRDAYGPAMRKDLWVVDGKAKTIGSGFRTVEFVSGEFAANRNIKSAHEAVYPTLMKLRFTRANYKWIELADEYSYYKLEPPADGDVGVWTGVTFHRLN